MIVAPTLIGKVEDTANRAADEAYPANTTAAAVAGRKLILATSVSRGLTPPGTLTPAFGGLAWTSMGSVVYDTAGTPLKKVQLWKATVGSEIASGTAFSISHNQASNGCNAGLYLCDANTADIIQSGITNAADGVLSSGNLALALAAAQNANSRSFAFFASDAGTAGSALSSANMTEIGELTHDTPGHRAAAYFSGSAFQANPAATPQATADMAGIAVELTHVATTAAVTGTIRPSSLESAIVAGSKTVIFTLTNATFVTDALGDPTPWDDNIEDFINAIVATASPANGWNNEVLAEILADPSVFVRTSDTVATLTLPAVAGYAIDADETIAAIVIPASILQEDVAIVATPNPAFTITAESSAGTPVAGKRYGVQVPGRLFSVLGPSRFSRVRF